jgi:hypothetical protein
LSHSGTRAMPKMLVATVRKTARPTLPCTGTHVHAARQQQHLPEGLSREQHWHSPYRGSVCKACSRYCCSQWRINIMPACLETLCLPVCLLNC